MKHKLDFFLDFFRNNDNKHNHFQFFILWKKCSGISLHLLEETWTSRIMLLGTANWVKSQTVVTLELSLELWIPPITIIDFISHNNLFKTTSNDSDIGGMIGGIFKCNLTRITKYSSTKNWFPNILDIDNCGGMVCVVSYPCKIERNSSNFNIFFKRK